MTDGIDSFLAAVRADPRIELHSLVALHRGQTVVEAYWEPWTAEDRVHVYSASKTVTGSAVGIAIGEGRLGLHDRVASVIDPNREVDPRIAAITVHHLLSMSTGHSAGPEWGEDEDPVDCFFGAVPEEPVGSRHAYNNLASWMLGELVRRVSRESLLAYLRPRLFEPLGIEATWETDEHGRELGFAGLRITTVGLARLGDLYRAGGSWEGRQLIPSGFVERAGQVQIATGPGDDVDWTTGYGYQVWISREGYRLDGAYGQFSLVLPEREAVIALTSAQATGSQPLLDLVFEHLVPAVIAGGRVDAPAGLQVTPLDDSGDPGPWWAAAPEPLPTQGHGLTDLRLSRVDGGWAFSASMDGHPVRASVPGPGWHRSLVVDDKSTRVAVSVGTSSGVGRVLLAFTGTVHILELELADGAGTLVWRTVPLGDPPLLKLIAD